MNKNLIIGTRYWSKYGNHNAIIEFLDAAMCLDPKMILVGLNSANDHGTAEALGRSRALERFHANVKVIPVEPWGKFVGPMNALIQRAILEGGEFFLSQSTEVATNPEQLDLLMSHMSKDTVCVGSRLPGHTFKPGQSEADGRSIPWNTMRIMRLSAYGLIGFPMIGDSPFDPTKSGVEELSADSILQIIKPESQIKLVEVPGIKWETGFENDPERLSLHEAKMASKNERPAFHLNMLGIRPAKVIHI